MKFNKSILLGVAAIAMTACSSDADFGTASQKDSANKRIAYQINVGHMDTRAITTISTIEQFNVTAYLTQGENVSKYMGDGNTINKVNGVWTPEKEYFWPRSGNLQFYSYSPAGVKVNMPAEVDAATVAPTIEYVANSNSERQEDLLYATNVTDAAWAYTGAPNATTLNINFRHALSQIVFCAQNTNPDWIVDIADVQMYNVLSRGKYTFPMETTSPISGSVKEVHGSWELNDILNSYTTKFEAKTNIGAQVVPLTTTTSGAILAIPQKHESWDPQTDANCKLNGTYFTVQCKIRQRNAAGGYDLLWPSIHTDTYEYIAVPVSIDWQEGKKYTYTFIFGDGAGYIPPTDTEGGEPVVPGDPALSKIRYNVTVDNFESLPSDSYKLGL